MFNDFRLWMVAGVALVALTNGKGAVEGVAEGQAVGAERNAARQERQALERKAREAEKISSVAMDRVRAGCVPVVANNPLITPEGVFEQEVRLVDGMKADNGHGTPLVNTYVCTASGDTAETDAGAITRKVVRASPENMEEYRQIFSRLSPSSVPPQVGF